MRDLVVTGRGEREPRPLLRTVLGVILRRVRRAQGRTLADVARAAKVSMPYLSEVERGRKEASSEVLAAICTALRIGLPELLAQAGRELAARQGARAGEALVIRLDAVRDGSAATGLSGPVGPAAPHGQAGATCLLAA